MTVVFHIRIMDSPSLPDILKLPKPIKLCQQGRFTELFQLYDYLTARNIHIFGYSPHDYLIDQENAKRRRNLAYIVEKSKLKHNEEITGIPISDFVGHHQKFEGYKPMYYAAAHGDVAAMRTLLEKYGCSLGIELDRYYSGADYKITPLQIACFNGHFDVVQYLIEKYPKCCLYQCRNIIDLVCYQVTEVMRFIDLEKRDIDDESKKVAKLECPIGRMGTEHIKIVKLIMKSYQINEFPDVSLKQILFSGDFKDLEIKHCDMSKLVKQMKTLKFKCIPFIGENYAMVEALAYHKVFDCGAELIKLAIQCLCRDQMMAILIKSCEKNPIYDIISCIESSRSLSLFDYIMSNWFRCKSIPSLVEYLAAKFGYCEDSEQRNMLHIACSKCYPPHDNLRAAKVIVGIQPICQSRVNSLGQLPLHIACIARQPVPPKHVKYMTEQYFEFIRYMSRKSDFETCDLYGNTPLHIACETENFILVCFLLKSQQLSINAIATKNRSGMMPLHYIFLHCSEHLPWIHLPHAQIIERDSEGNTILHLACQHYNVQLETIEHLVNAVGFLTNAANDQGMLPLHTLFAAEHHIHEDFEKIIDILCYDEAAKSQDLLGNTVLHLACGNLSMPESILRYMINQKGCTWKLPNQQGKLPVHSILKAVDTTGRRLIVEKEDGSFIFMPINGTWHHRAATAPFVELLLVNIDVNFQDCDGNSPLHMACILGHVPVINCLLNSAEIMVTLQNRNGELPLHLLLKTGCNNLWTISSLMTRENLFVHDSDGNSPLHVLAQTISESSDDSDNSFKKILLLFVCVNYPNYLKMPFDTMKSVQLLTLRSDIMDLLKLENKEKCTPLHYLLNRVSFQLLQCLFSPNPQEVGKNNDNCFDFLPVTFCDMNHPNSKTGITPFQEACRSKDESLAINMLRRVSGDASEQNFYRDREALYMAFIRPHLDIVKFLHKKVSNIFNTEVSPLEIFFYQTCRNTTHLSLEEMFMFESIQLHNLIDSRYYELIEYLLHHQSYSHKSLDAGFSNFVVQLACRVKFSELDDYYIDNCSNFVAHDCSLRQPPFSHIDKISLYLMAAFYCRIDLMKYLIEEENIDPLCIDGNKCNALDYLCRSDQIYVNLYFEWSYSPNCFKACAQFVIGSGCNPFESDTIMNKTAFSAACKSQNPDMVMAILFSSTLVNYMTENGNTPLLSFVEYQHYYHFEDDFIVTISKFFILGGMCNPLLSNLDQCNVLHYACKDQSFLCLIRLLKDCDLKVLVAQSNRSGQTPPDIACRHGNLEIVKYIVEETLINDKPALLALLKSSLFFKKYDIVEYLHSILVPGDIERSHSGTLNCTMDSAGNTVLHLATQFNARNLVKKWLKRNCSILLKCNHDGDTLFHIACKFHSLKTLKILLKYADENKSSGAYSLTTSRNMNGDSPLHIACSNGSIPCIKALSPRGLNVLDNDGNTPLHVACQKKHFAATHFLLSYFYDVGSALSTPNHDNEFPVFIALKKFSRKPVSYLRLLSLHKMVKLTEVYNSHSLQIISEIGRIEYASFANHIRQRLSRFTVSQSVNRKLPLHHAASVSLEFVKACVLSDYVNAQDEAGNTALHIACANGKYDICKYLINEMGSIALIKNKKGETPLHMACSISPVNSDIVAFLLNQLSLIPSNNGDYPLHLLCKNYSENNFKVALEMIKFLKFKQCDIISLSNKDTKFLPLHHMCVSREENAVQIVEALIPLTSNVNTKTSKGDTPLHLACKRERHDFIQLLTQAPLCDITITDRLGNTPLHLVSLISSKSMDVVEKCYKKEKIHGKDISDKLKKYAYDTWNATFQVLVSQATINACNKDGNTPLMLLLQNPHLYKYSEINSFYVEVLTMLLSFSPSFDCNKDGLYPIHVALQYQELPQIELLGTDHISKHTKNEDNALHMVCKNENLTVDMVEYILEVHKEKSDLTNEKNCDGNLPLHILCMFSIEEEVCTLLMERCDINTQNKEGNTPLHLALLNDKRGGIHDRAIDSMALDDSVDLTLRNNAAQTILDLATNDYNPFQKNLVERIVQFHLSNTKKLKTILESVNKDFILQLFLSDDVKLVKSLIECDIDPTPLYNAHKDFFQNELKPPQLPASILVIGDAETGKTTLINSLKREAGLILDEEVPERTAGIIPSSFSHEKYGDVTTYDFAGQREYYAGHEAVMQNILQKFPPIILLVVKLSKPLEDIEKNIVYWSSFVKNRLKNVSGQAHFVIVCSFADVACNPDEKTVKLLTYASEKISGVSTMEFVDIVSINCRLSSGLSIEKVVRILTESASTIRKDAVLSFKAHCLLVLLMEQFKGEVAVTISEIFIKLKGFMKFTDRESMTLVKDNRNSTTSYIIIRDTKQGKKFYSMLPTSLKDLIELCNILASNHKIMLLEINRLPQSGWVVFNKEVLLNDVTGKLLAPEDFTNYEQIAFSKTGIVSFAAVRNTFPQHDANMVFNFLQALEYCYEVDDVHIKESIFKLDITTLVPNDKYFFFPSLISSDRPKLNWLSNIETSEYCHFGWVLRCKEDDTFTPNFIQILLLRLIFGSTRVTAAKFIACKIGSISQIWKSGISWCDGKGVQAIVDVVDTAKQVFVFMRSKNHVNLLRRRATLVHFVRNLRAEILPLALVTEYAIHFKVVKEYFASIDSSDVLLVPIDEVCRSVNKGDEEFVSSHGPFPLEELTLFDPYSHICTHLVQQIISAENERKTLPDKFLNALADHLHKKFDLFKQLLNLSPTALTEYLSHGPDGPTFKFARMLRMWRNQSKRTYGDVRHLFNTISIFKETSYLSGKAALSNETPL